jgi:hypothetical protein
MFNCVKIQALQQATKCARLAATLGNHALQGG